MSVFDSAWAQLGAVGLLGLVVLLVATGRLIPAATARTLVEQANATTARWQAAAQKSDERADEAVRLLGEVVSALRAVEALVRSPGRRDAA